MKATFVAALLTATLLSAAAPVGAQEKPPEPPPSGSGSTGSGGVKPEPAGPLQVGDVVWTVGGKRVDMLPAGSRADVEVTIQNAGTETAKGVAISIAPSEGSGHIVNGSASLGDIPAGGSAHGSLAIVADEKDCRGFVGFGVSMTSSLGDQPSTIGAGVLCPGPQLYVVGVTFLTTDGDDVPEPGETVKITVTLTNGGRDPATGVTGSLSFADPNITVIAGSSSWPDIASGAQADNGEPFVITISKDAKTQQSGCGGMAVDTAANGDGTVSSDPAASTAPDDRPSDTPVPAPPAGTPEPAPGDEAPPRVTFEGTLSVAASGKSFDAPVGDVMVCMYSETAGGGTAGGAPAPGPNAPQDDKATRDVALGAHGASNGGSTTVALLVMAALALALLVNRFRRPRATDRVPVSRL